MDLFLLQCGSSVEIVFLSLSIKCYVKIEKKEEGKPKLLNPTNYLI